MRLLAGVPAMSSRLSNPVYNLTMLDAHDTRSLVDPPASVVGVTGDRGIKWLEGEDG